MTVLSRPRHPIVADALVLAGEWCRGQIIDGAPALGHAVKVALVLGRHVPNASPELVAAVLLHDSPEYAPKDVDLDALLTARFGPAVTRIVRGLEREHIALDERPVPDVTTEDRWTLYASAADKIVSLRSILRRASLAADPAAYWQSRRAFVTRVPYFAAFHTSAAPHLPPGMAGDLARLIVRAEQAATRYPSAAGGPGCTRQPGGDGSTDRTGEARGGEGS
jgi:hypothetical protein